MHPTIYGEDWLFCQQVTAKEDIWMGRIYVVVMRDGVVCKRLQAHDDPEKVQLLSDNETYGPYTVAKEDILRNGLWAVKYKMTAVLGNKGGQSR